MWNGIKVLCSLSLCFSSLLWADCGVQSLNKAPPFTPIKSSLYDISYSDLLGKNGERVTVQDDLPSIIVTQKALLPPHWAESVAWDAYQQTGQGPALLTLYFDNNRRLCRLEKRDFTPAFYRKRPDLRSRSSLQEMLDFRKAARNARGSDMRLEEVIWFDYAPSGQLLAAQRFDLNANNQLTLNVRRCFYYNPQGNLLGEDERDTVCPAEAPADLSPRYIYTETGQLVRVIRAHLDMAQTANNAEPKPTQEVSVYDETGEIARYLPDENQRMFRMPKRDWPVKDSYERAPSNLVVTENWRLKLFDMNWPLKDSAWAIQEKLLVEDAPMLAPSEWKSPLLKGKTDAQGLLNLNPAQSLLLWEAVKRSPGTFILRFNFGLNTEARLYPPVEEAVWADCLKLDHAANNLCH